VWSDGLACGVPILNFFTLIPAFRRVNTGLPTLYDLGLVSVRDYSNNAIRRSIGMLVTIALLGFIGIVNMREGTDQSQLSTRWTNPQTGVSTTIPADWVYGGNTGTGGDTIYGWANVRTGEVVGLAFNKLPGATLEDYQNYNKAELKDSTGFDAWTTKAGVSTASGLFQGSPATLYITQRGKTFWRIFYMDRVSKTPRQIVAPEMTAALLSTFI
jgi:hypothetical protein